MEWMVLAGRSQQWIFSALKLLTGILFSLTGLFLGQTFAASLEDERFGVTGKVSKVLAGVVVHIKRGGLMDQTTFLMNLVPINNHGQPLCRKLSGHLVTVFKSRLYESRREHSAFVVMEDPIVLPSKHLSIGDCLTIKAWKVRSLLENKATNEDQIRILPLPRSGKKRFFQAFSIKFWREEPTRSSGGVFSRR